MKRTIFQSVFILFAFALFTISCEEKETNDPPVTPTPTPVDTNFKGIKMTNTGTITVSFSEYFGDSMLKAAPYTYQTASGDTVKITDIKYYISHITFYNAAGAAFNTMKHNLFTFGNLNNSVSLPMPAGNYTRMSFLLGVDSLANHSGAQEGDLDPGNGMFWSWSTGYIFYRIKARHGVAEQSISYDIGGLNNLLKIELDLKDFKVLKNNPSISIHQNMETFFNAPNVLQLKTVTQQVHTADNPFIPTLKANMANMFELGTIQ